MANLFERAVKAYDPCLEHIDPNYLDAANARGSSRIVLGQYEAAFCTSFSGTTTASSWTPLRAWRVF